ncbi:MAG TPA: DUF2818 family protein [Burkholderiales bacterium]|nr:DUF2818 family protein [Burkholderiales bacterium]
MVFLLLLVFIAANLPFFSERLLFVIRPKSGVKNFGWRLLEVLLLYLIVGGVGYLLEARAGNVHEQSWEFYAITLCLFLVFAYPGFVYRYLWRKHS